MVVITLLSFGASAQETTSEIQGLVSDGKAGLTGVTIVATHQPTGTKYTTSSRADGGRAVSARRNAHEQAMMLLDYAGVLLALMFALFIAFYGGLFL